MGEGRRVAASPQYGERALTLSATGFNVIFAFFLPSGRPRCDMRITALAPFFSASSMVGIAPTMRCGLVIAPVLSCGTCERQRRERDRVGERVASAV